MHVRKKSQAFELTPGQTLQISILEKLNYLRGSIGLCENHRRLASFRAPGFALVEAVAFTVHFQNVHVMGQAIQ